MCVGSGKRIELQETNSDEHTKERLAKIRRVKAGQENLWGKNLPIGSN